MKFYQCKISEANHNPWITCKLTKIFLKWDERRKVEKKILPQTLWNIKQIETYYFRQTALLSPLRGFCALKSLQLETDERSHEREKDRLLALLRKHWTDPQSSLPFITLSCPSPVSILCNLFSANHETSFR